MAETGADETRGELEAHETMLADLRQRVESLETFRDSLLNPETAFKTPLEHRWESLKDRDVKG